MSKTPNTQMESIEASAQELQIHDDTPQTNPSTQKRRKGKKRNKYNTPHHAHHHHHPFAPHLTPQSLCVPLMNNLGTERAYLMDSLRRQTERARNLCESLSRIEERLNGKEEEVEDPTLADAGSEQRGNERRKLRREASLLRSKIAGYQEQERLILLRLGDLYVQNSWQTQEPYGCGHHYFYQPTHVPPVFMPPPPPPMAYHYYQPQYPEMGPIQMAQPYPPMPGPRAFVPGVEFSPNFSWAEPGGHMYDMYVDDGYVDGGFYQFSPMNPGNPTAPYAEQEQIVNDDYGQLSPTNLSGSSVSNEAGVVCFDIPDNTEQAIRDVEATPVPQWQPRSTSVHHLNLEYAPKPQDKRMSVPSLRTIWPEPRRMSHAEGVCDGSGAWV